ncbi:MAG: hypothetical protein IT562_23915 [Alphaproteobacteria bacterium]|nr:hypothetical protein [Alphaproteobacteria bacterium]
MLTLLIRFLAQDVVFGLACAAVSVALAVVGLWGIGIALGDDPALLLALAPKVGTSAP